VIDLRNLVRSSKSALAFVVSKADEGGVKT
jgi:hypothetical protein